jgi:hypothetical protein
MSGTSSTIHRNIVIPEYCGSGASGKTTARVRERTPSAPTTRS